MNELDVILQALRRNHKVIVHNEHSRENDGPIVEVFSSDTRDSELDDCAPPLICMNFDADGNLTGTHRHQCYYCN